MSLARQALRLLLATLLLLVGGLYALLDSTTGTRLLVAALQAGGFPIRVQHVRGGILGPLDLDGVRVRWAGTSVTLRRVQLDWRPSALLRRRLSIHRLRLYGLEVRLPQARSARTSPPLTIPPLPAVLPGGLSVRLDALDIDRARVARGKRAPLELSALHLCASLRDSTLTICPSSAAPAGFGAFAFSGKAQLDRHDLRLDRLRVDSGSTRLSAHGRIGYGAAPSALTLRVSTPRWPLDSTRPAVVDDLSGTLTLDGRVQGYRYRLDATGTLHRRPLHLRAAGRGDQRRLAFDSLQLDAGSGRITGDGQLRWAPAVSGQARLKLSRVDPELLAKGFPGDLNGMLTARTGSDGAVNFSLRLRKSRLRGYPLEADAAGRWHRPTLQFDTLSLRSATTRLSASGRVTPAMDLKFSVRSSDLASLLPDSKGQVQAEGRLQGTAADPHVLISARGDGLRFRRYRLARVTLDADLDPRQPSHLDVEIHDAQAGLTIRRARLTAVGRLEYQQIRFSAQTGRGSLRFTAAGGYDRRRREWGGSLLTAHLAPQGLGALDLQRPAGILIGGRRKSLEPACLSGSDGQICGQLQQNVPSPGLWLSWSLHRARLATLEPLLPSEWRINGQADGQGRIRLVGGNLKRVTAHLDLSGTTLALPGTPKFTLESGHLDAEQDAAGRLQARLTLRLPQGGLEARALAAPGAELLQRALSGECDVDFPDIAFLQPLLPQTSGLGGRIEGRLTLGGTLGRPRLAGRIGLAAGRAKLTVPGIQLSRVELALVGDGSGPLKLVGSMSSGGGNLNVEGGVDPTAKPWHGDLRISGRDFQAVDTSQARIWVSPDLQLEYFPGFVKLTGTLRVPKANITPTGLTNKGIAPSSDQVLVGGPPRPPPTPLKTVVVVAVKLGDAVHFDGFGLTTDLGGAVKVIDYTMLPQALAQGELHLRGGRYKAYGQDLTIERGQLIFSGGPVTQPAIDLLALRKPSSSVTVKVQVRGPLAQPRLTLSSDPPMPREQQLAWLVLGHPLNQTSGSDRQAIASAALGLGLAGGDFLANRIGKSLGLTVSLGADNGGASPVAASPSMIQRITGSSSSPQAGTTALTLGKYLTPRLFVSYGVSLLQPGNVFRLLYDLGRGFRLEAESGVVSGGDLVYTVQSK